MFTPKDRTAYRYFHKRAHYIAVIASSLAALGKGKGKKGDEGKVWGSMRVEWEYEGGDMRRPVAVLTFPKGESARPRT
jgi:U3 small nucleolar RNA-associated protein 22